jgi:hypothetical protein
MDSLRLTIPQQIPKAGVAAFFNAAKLKDWLDALPLANPRKTGQELLTALQQTNRTPAPANQRFHFLEQCRPLIADITDTLHKHYAAASIPLEDKHRTTAELVHALLAEMAYGYKAIVLTTSAAPLNDANRNMLVASALCAMHHLAKLMVDSYALYLPEPASVWLELHQIYRYADYEDFASRGYPLEGQAGDVRSIDHTYRRIIMLALANPYHLMQGEAQLVFRELDKWASHCRILPLGAGVSPNSQFYLDLDSDTPPGYAPSSAKVLYPVDGRTLDISGTLAAVEQRSKALLAAAKTESGQLTLAGRKLRNMYKRLTDAWGIRVERLSERKPRSTPLEIAIGLSAAHHFAGHGTEFAPESNEIELRHGKGRGKDQELTLFSENDAPWVHEDQASRLATGIVQPRTSQFATDPAKDKDVWVKIYSTQVHFESNKGQSTPTFDSTACQLQDESRGGMAISCRKGHGMRLLVGEVIAFKSEHAPNPDDWSIGVVRWLRTTTQEQLELGIGLLADDTLPVATRGVKGVGKDSEYFRSLLIPRMDPTQYPTTLITPAAVYDLDSVVLVNTGSDVFYAQLTKIMNATNSFALFQFKIVDAP